MACCGCFNEGDARRGGNEVAGEVARRWFERREAGAGLGREKRDWRVDVE